MRAGSVPQLSLLFAQSGGGGVSGKPTSGRYRSGDGGMIPSASEPGFGHVVGGASCGDCGVILSGGAISGWVAIRVPSY